MSQQRATTIDEFERLMGEFIPTESVAQGLALELRPTDVVISPYAKCGTTWLQQMVHTLRTGGDMEFDDISRVVPWIETSTALGLDLDADQRGEPRAFKSHLPWQPMPRGGRYIVCVREPGKALVSLYRFMVGWFIEPSTVTLDEFATWYINRRGGRDYWTHFLSWWPRRQDPDVLLLAFELMKEAPGGHVVRVAEFCGIEADDVRIDLAVRCSSLDFMLEYADRYDDALLRKRSEEVLDLPAGSETAKVKAELPPGAFDLSSSAREKLDRKWQETILPTTGLASYAEVLTSLRQE